MYAPLVTERSAGTDNSQPTCTLPRSSDGGLAVDNLIAKCIVERAEAKV
jgi:hypothetical protein